MPAQQHSVDLGQPPVPLPTCVHAGEHQAQGRHGPVRTVHIHSVHTELDQGLGVQPGKLLGQQEALQAPQDTVVDGGRSGLLTSGQHHPTHLNEIMTSRSKHRFRLLSLSGDAAQDCSPV